MEPQLIVITIIQCPDNLFLSTIFQDFQRGNFKIPKLGGFLATKIADFKNVMINIIYNDEVIK